MNIQAPTLELLNCVNYSTNSSNFEMVNSNMSSSMKMQEYEEYENMREQQIQSLARELRKDIK